jgi:poly-gamma-glutamate synthesis protein (capsule biosynthesis protein)
MGKRVGTFGSVLIFLALVAFVFLLAKNFNTSYTVSKNPATKEPLVIPKVTIDSIFTKQNDLSKLDQKKLVTLDATGDVIIARGSNWPAITSKNFNYNWEDTASFLKKADITLIDLESPLIAGCQLMTSGMTFCGDSRQIAGLVFAGVDVASLPNNHIGNYGQQGITETENLLEKNGIDWSGFDKMAVKTIKGVKFGFLAYNGVGTTFDREGMAAQIVENKKKVDVLVVSAHWGMEYELTPKPAPGVSPDDPKEIAHLIIDSGADLVIGNHPHTVQGVELYKGKLITYAHGNFIFDQTWSQETQEGVVGEYLFYGKDLVNVKFHPTLVDVSYKPRFLSEKDGQHILDRMLQSSQQISSNKP